MNISRKNFFKQSLLSLGDAVLSASGMIAPASDAATERAAVEQTSAPLARPDMSAISFNERCLARNCGCFACVERCESQAIMVVPGEGIRIDQSRCTGCGNCEYVCPVTPKAVILAPRQKS